MVDTTHTPSVRELQSTTDYGRFQIEPLEPGFGTTLGNSLRRVLLSSLSGAAINSSPYFAAICLAICVIVRFS